MEKPSGAIRHKDIRNYSESWDKYCMTLLLRILLRPLLVAPALLLEALQQVRQTDLSGHECTLCFLTPWSRWRSGDFLKYNLTLWKDKSTSLHKAREPCCISSFLSFWWHSVSMLPLQWAFQKMRVWLCPFTLSWPSRWSAESPGMWHHSSSNAVSKLIKNIFPPGQVLHLFRSFANLTCGDNISSFTALTWVPTIWSNLRILDSKWTKLSMHNLDFSLNHISTRWNVATCGISVGCI